MTNSPIVVDGIDATAATNTSTQPQGSQIPTSQVPEQNTANEEAAQNPYEPRKRKKSSPVWVNFKEVMVGTEKKWECIHCKVKFKRVPSGTTTHLGRHIERCPRRPQNLVGQNQQQLSVAANNYFRHVQLVREKLYELFEEYVEEYKAREVENRSEMVVETVASASTDSGKEKKLSGQDMLDSIVRNVSSSAATVKSELDNYLEAALAERSTDFNVIEWWKENRLTYKILSRMATEIMAIPITSVASEAAFSAGGRVIEPSRARLGKKTIQALLCSQDWLKNHYGLTRSSKVSFNFLFT
ncbi:Zinc finger BED domain-containing protein RICESLEEPER 3 [Linum perenne]